MTNAAAALNAIYLDAMNRAEIAHQHGDESLEFCAQAELEALGYHGVEVDALDLMRETDRSVVCVLCTGAVAKVVGDKIVWKQVDVTSMN